VPDVEVVGPSSADDPALAGTMTETYRRSTRTVAPTWSACTRTFPPGVAPAANELGWRLGTDKLAKLVERRAE
jgi:hypothetical protein